MHFAHHMLSLSNLIMILHKLSQLEKSSWHLASTLELFSMHQELEIWKRQNEQLKMEWVLMLKVILIMDI
jgi:hypothetical protein